MSSRYRKVKNSQGQVGWARLVPFTFGLNLAPAALADLATITGSITTDTGLPFILTEMRCAADSDTSTNTYSRLLFTITDGESQQLFSNIPIDREAMFGSKDFPRQLPSEVEIRPADTITVTMTNRTGGALSTTVRIALGGYKLVGWTPSQPQD